MIEALKQLEECRPAEQPIPYTTKTYLDADIIDLTAIPPPMEGNESVLDNSSNFQNNETSTLHFDSNRVVADLDSLCSTLSELRTHPPSSDLVTSNNIEEFIAELTVPPPPEVIERPVEISEYTKNGQNSNIKSFVIPPPPTTYNLKHINHSLTNTRYTTTPSF